MKPPWRPRASSLGNYFACLWRAVHDRLAYEDRLPPGTPQKNRADTAYADLGDLVHFALQDGARCRFAVQPNPDPEEVEKAAMHMAATLSLPLEQATVAARKAFQEGNPLAYQPGFPVWSSASGLFGGDGEETASRVRAAASLAFTSLPKCPTGMWIAEQHLELDYLTGHMDFLSETWEDGVDLKSTSMKPPGQKMKMGHLYQMVGYHLLTERRLKRCPVLYVDSQHADWTVLVPLDLTTDSMQFLADQVEAFCRFLMSDRLFDVAYPNLGDHCHRSWCNWQPGCKDWFAPAAGRFFSPAKNRTPLGSSTPKFSGAKS